VPSVLVQRAGRPQTALSWILALFMVPPLALLSWWLIGRTHLAVKRRGRRRAESRFDDRLERSRAAAAEPPQASPQLLDAVNLPQELRPWVFPPTGGNQVTLQPTPAIAFDAWEQALRRARHHAHLLFYIFHDDATGTRFRDLLVELARRGVEVRVLVDFVGTHKTPKSFFQPLIDAGGQVVWFLPPALWRRNSAINFRNHRKIIVVDGAEAFVGGINIGDEYLGWLDLSIHIRGAAVDQVQEVFCDDWYFAAGVDLADPAYFGRAGGGEPPGDDVSCATIAGGPHQHLNAIREIVLLALTSARRRIWIMTPYFVPDAALLMVLRLARYRGVEVRLMVPADSDVPIVRRASRAYYPELLQVGVRIVEYAGMVHAKAIVLDDRLTSVGSANLDTRSFRLHFEVSCLVDSEAVNGDLARCFDEAAARSVEVSPAEYEKLPWPTRLVDAAVHLLSPLL
jgi:cardiolipin synthase